MLLERFFRQTNPAVTTLLVATRGLHYLGCWLLAGGLGFRLFVLPASGAAEQSVRRCAWVGLALAAVSGLIWLWIEMASMSGESLFGALQWDIASAVLRGTHFGHFWVIRAGLAGLLSMQLRWLGPCSRGEACWPAPESGPDRSPEDPRSSNWKTALAWVVSCAFLGTLCGVGHAAAENSHWILPGFDALHLIASGLWPGALFPLAVFLFGARHSEGAMRLVPIVTRRFSRLSLFVVAVLGLSGVVNACVLLGQFDALWKTGYGITLCVKLLLFAVMLAFAAINLLYITPRLTPTCETEGRLFRLLWRNVGAEVILGIAVALVVGLLGVTEPPH